MPMAPCCSNLAPEKRGKALRTLFSFPTEPHGDLAFVQVCFSITSVTISPFVTGTLDELLHNEPLC